MAHILPGHRRPQPAKPEPQVPFFRRRRYPLIADCIAPSNLLAAATDTDLIELSWTDNSTNETGFRIERSLDNVVFTTLSTVGPNVTTFNDTGLDPETTYYYRVVAICTGGDSVPSGVAFARTQACPSSANSRFSQQVTLPRWFESGGQRLQDIINEMAEKLEDVLNRQALVSEPCNVCEIVDGAIVIDAGRCSNFEVPTTENITSITVQNPSPGQNIKITFRNPTTTNKTVTGFPQNTACDRCGTVENGGLTVIPFTLEPLDFTVDSEGNLVESSGGEGGGSGGPLIMFCEEEVDAGDFANAQTATCAKIDCASGTPHLNFRAIGGNPPYTWTAVGNGTDPDPTVAVSGTDNEEAEVTPPAPGTALGLAYVMGTRFWTNNFGPCTVCSIASQGYDCDDDTFSTCNGFACGVTDTFIIGSSSDFACNTDPDCKNPGAGCGGFPECQPSVSTCGTMPPLSPASNTVEFDWLCDKRTPAQIATGCAPCRVVMPNAVVTVTDQNGTQISSVVEVE